MERLIDAGLVLDNLSGRLESMKDYDGCGDGEQIYDDGRSQGRFEAFGKAIEIVKGGVPDGN